MRVGLFGWHMSRRRAVVSVLVALTLVLAALLSACGSSESEEKEPLKVVFIGDSSPDDVIWAFITGQMRKAAERLNIEFVDRYASGDFALQARMVDEELARGVDAITGAFFDPEASNAAIRKALAEGVVVYDMGGGPQLEPDELAQLGSFVLDWVEVGRQYGYIALPLLSDGANVLWPAEVPSASYITDAVIGFEEAAAEQGITVNVTVLDATSDMSTSASRQLAYLLANPDTDAIVSSGAIATAAANTAMRQADLPPGSPFIVGEIGDPASARGVVDGYMPGGLWLGGSEEDYFAVLEDIIAMCQGADAIKRPFPMVRITAENARDYLPPEFFE